MSDESEPVRYVGRTVANTEYHDGQLRPVVGVQSHQVLRANRSHPDWVDDTGWTYNHAPMLAYWNGRFYLEYLSNPVDEHGPPGQTLLTTSEDGIHWERPEVVFRGMRCRLACTQGRLNTRCPQAAKPSCTSAWDSMYPPTAGFLCWASTGYARHRM